MVPSESRAAAVDRSLVALEQEVETLRQAIAAMRAGAPAEKGSASDAKSELRRVRTLNEQLSERTDAAERRLADLLEGLITAMQAENARLMYLIDTVQSSHFWTLKRSIARLLRRG